MMCTSVVQIQSSILAWGAAHGIYSKNLYNTAQYPDQEVRYSGRVIGMHFVPFCKTSLQDQDLPVI